MQYNISPSGVPILSKSDLESIADSHTRSFIHFDGKDSPRFSVWKFAAYFLKKSVSFEYLSNNACILGLSIFVDDTPIPVYEPEKKSVVWRKMKADTILLDKSLHSEMGYEVNKCRFTLMHECAHQLLHGEYYRGIGLSRGAVAYSIQKKQAADRLSVVPRPTWTNVDWIEWQANYLASALLMPKHRIKVVLGEFDFYDRYRIEVENKRYEPLAFDSFAYNIASVFRVSPITARIRLETVGVKRLEDQYEAPPDPYGPPTPKTQDEILQEWEERYLDPDVLYV